MSIRTGHEKEFISLFNSIARGTWRLQVFTDFISCSVIAIQNGLQFCLLACVVNGLEDKVCDYPCRIYMLPELGGN